MPQRKFEQWLSVCLELSAPGGTCSMREGISAEAFLLFDPSLNPVFVSRLAVEVRFIPQLGTSNFCNTIVLLHLKILYAPVFLSPC